MIVKVHSENPSKKEAWVFYLPDNVSELDKIKFKHSGFFFHLLEYTCMNGVTLAWQNKLAWFTFSVI